MFKADPAKYLPQFGGYCAFGAAMRKKFDGDPTVWKVVDGKLYLNLAGPVQMKWDADQANLISQAAMKWDWDEGHPGCRPEPVTDSGGRPLAQDRRTCPGRWKCLRGCAMGGG